MHMFLQPFIFAMCVVVYTAFECRDNESVITSTSSLPTSTACAVVGPGYKPGDKLPIPGRDPCSFDWLVVYHMLSCQQVQYPY